jgi:mannosyltransferase
MKSVDNLRTGARMPQQAQPNRPLFMMHAAQRLRSPYVKLVLILLLGLTLRVFHLDYLSLWNDETFSRYYYQSGIRYMWTDGLQWESSPPLYYMAIGAWMQIFGASENAMRSLSVGASFSAILLVYALGRETLGQRRALLAAALFSASATQIYFAQEARPYALLLLPVATLLLACARYLRGQRSVLNLLCFGTSAVLCIYTHATMVFLVAACGASVLAYSTIQWRRREGVIPTGWVIVNAGVALLSLPEILGMLTHVHEDRLAWIPPLTPSEIDIVLSQVVLGPLNGMGFPGEQLAALLLCSLGLSLWLYPPNRHVSVVLIAIPCLYVASVFAASLFQPILVSRIFCWTWIPLCLLLAHALSVRSYVRLIVGLATFLVFGIGLADQLGASADSKEPWRSVVRQIQPALTRAHLVVLGPQTDPSNLFYYAPATEHVRMWVEGSPLTSEETVLPRLFDTPQITRQETIKRINSGAPVVMLLRAGGVGFLPEIMSQTPPPQDRIDRYCGAYLCLTVLSWHDSLGEN